MARAACKPFRIVVFQEGDQLCAQYVDVDLSAQARTLPELYRALDRLIRGHIAVRRRYKQRPFEDLPPAPQKYREMFERSKIQLPTQLVRLEADGIVVPPPEVRVAAPTTAA